MNTPTLQSITAFAVRGFSIRTQNKDEFNAPTAKLPGLWQQFYSSELAINPDVFEVYSNYESDANGWFTTTVGVMTNDNHHGLSLVQIHSGPYLVFKGKGAMPDAVITTWQHIWDYFRSNTPYQRHYLSDFEAYRNGDEVFIHIGIIE